MQHGPLSSLPLKVYDFTVPISEPMMFVQILKESSVSVTLDAQPARKRPQKRSDALPFGLKAPRKKRAKKTVALTQAASSKVSSSSTGHNDMGCNLGLTSLHDDVMDAEDSGSDSGLSKSGSDSSSKESASSSSSSDTNGEPLSFDPECRKEEKETRDVLRSHAEIAPTHDMLLRDPPPAPIVAVNAASVKTQCQPTIGVCDVGQQVSGRLAQCRHCKEKISKGSTRVAYSFSVTKFFAWIHPSCFLAYLDAVNGSSAQAISFLTDWIENHPDSSLEMKRDVATLVSKLSESTSC